MAQNFRKAVVNGKPAAFLLQENRVYLLHNSGKWSHDADAEVTNKKTFKYAADLTARWSDLARLANADAETFLYAKFGDTVVFLEGTEGYDTARKPRQRKKRGQVAHSEAAEVIEAIHSTQKPERPAAVEEEEEEEEAAEVEEVVEVEEKPAEKPAEQPQNAAQVQYTTPTQNAAQDAFTAAFTPLFAGVAQQIEQRIRAEVSKEVEELRRIANSAARRIEVVSPQGVNTVSGLTCENFAAIVSTVNAGIPVYMYGPAGTGKSYTAKKVAEALGLPFYESMQVLFAHDLKGYGDAGGEYVPTPFYKAFTNGGLFFLDEADASAAEALTVLNTAIANRRFEFPVVGNVEAHPNFRVIAAGNTMMSGADSEYVARVQQDASFKNRFFFVPVDYDARIEAAMCDGDENILEFVRDLRSSAQERRISLVCSYRQIKQMHILGDVWSAEDLLRGAVFQEKDFDEIRILYHGLNHQSNPWAKAMAVICGED